MVTRDTRCCKASSRSFTAFEFIGNVLNSHAELPASCKKTRSSPGPIDWISKRQNNLSESQLYTSCKANWNISTLWIGDSLCLPSVNWLTISTMAPTTRRFWGPVSSLSNHGDTNTETQFDPFDSRVTGRTGKVFVKEFETPKRMPCYLLLDTSSSMVVSSFWRTKYATALHIAGGLAFACLDRVSPVGLITTGSDEYRVEPSLSQDQIMQWLHHLRRFNLDQQTVLAKRLNHLCAN